MTSEGPNLLTTGEAAKLCSVTPDTVLKWIKKGRLTGTRTAGGHYRLRRGDLEPLMLWPDPGDQRSDRGSAVPAEGLRCWEYLSDGKGVRPECQGCVVYRVRASRCFVLADLVPDLDHSRRFCPGTCEECVYYRRAKGLPTNVLVVTADDELVDRLAGEETEKLALRFARNSYEASAIIHEFRPAFVVADTDRIPVGDTELLDSLGGDARLPGVRVILLLPARATGQKRRRPKSDLIVGALEKPCGIERLVSATEQCAVVCMGGTGAKGALPASLC